MRGGVFFALYAAKSMVRTKQDSYVAAVEFWMGVECLTPSSAPKCKKDSPGGPLTWEIHTDTGLPWFDRDKIAEVQGLLRARASQIKRPVSELTVQFTAYCGLIPVPKVVELIRQQFGIAVIEESEPSKLEPVATLALTLDANGFVVGDPFVSSLPWAVNQILCAKPDENLDFTGFFGKENLLDRLLEELDRAQELLYLKNAAAPEDESARGAAAEGELRPLNIASIDALCKQVYAVCGWNPSNPIAAVRVQAKVLSLKQAEKAESSDLLNSFFVEDLGKITTEIKRGNYGAALDSYMTGRLREDRVDVRDEADTSVEKMVLPHLLPMGCWPSEHGLVRAQQFAVNKIMQRLRASSGIFSVNGPPGTGKTTLLRDIVAAVVVERAHAMSCFTHPLDAFSEQLKVDGWTFGKTWAIDGSLRKSGIVVASSNNGAVENITKELPAKDALPKGALLRYLSAVSDSIAAAPMSKQRNHDATWGLVAAVMGSKANRNAFFRKLRWSPNKKNAENVELYEHPFVSLWDLMTGDSWSALAWCDAVEAFKAAQKTVAVELERMRSTAAEVEKKSGFANAILGYESQLVRLEATLTQLVVREEQAKQESDQAAAGYRHAKVIADTLSKFQQVSGRLSQQRQEFSDGEYHNVDVQLENAEIALVRAQDSRQVAERLLTAATGRKPGFLSSLFSLGKSSESWRLACKDAEDALRGATRELRAAEYSLDESKSRLNKRNRSAAEIKRIDAELALAAEECRRLGISSPESAVVDMKQLIALNACARDAVVQYEQAKRAKQEAETSYRDSASRLQVARAGFAKSSIALREKSVTLEMEEAWLGVGRSEEASQLMSPWFDGALFSARQELFCQAMALHESFIAHSWPKMKNNLSALIAIEQGEFSVHDVTGGVERLWDSLFMVVPVISTTFASFARMFDGWERESIGWLLIDEAGQATPQAATGAIWRSQRVVVVGDPRQLVPVVSLPPQLMVPLMERCKADAVYHPITSSVQVLADMSNQFGTHLGKDDNAQWVGSPLRVHRRCLDPMFSVANEISYDNMMVYGAKDDTDDLWFGRSCWIDVPATSRNGNCVPAQIDAAVQMAMEFEKHYDIKAGGKYNLYLITPFRDVRNALEHALRSRLKNQRDVSGMFGTVHTFQGKESDVVILVLGGTPGSIAKFAAGTANLLNVALTRAKRRIYVIGAKSDWADAPFYTTLYNSPKLAKRSTVPAILFPQPAKGLVSSDVEHLNAG